MQPFPTPGTLPKLRGIDIGRHRREVLAHSDMIDTTARALAEGQAVR